MTTIWNDLKEIAEEFGIKTRKDVLRWSLLLICLIGCVLVGCGRFNAWLGIEDDHPIEEKIEEVIQDQTGLPVDLTPDSPEDEN